MRMPRRLAVDSFPLLVAVFLFPFPSGAATGGVAGVVVDGQGRPVADAKVEMTRTSGGFPTSCGCSQDEEIYRARTGPPAGRFEVRSLAGFLVRAADRSPGLRSPDPEGSRRAGGRRGGDFGRLTLDAGRKLDGIVVDGEGRPLANTAIWIRGREPRLEGYPFLQRGPRQVTGADGKFSIPIEKGGSFEIYACRRDRSRFTWTLDGLPQPFRIVLPSSGHIPGRIVDPEGTPFRAPGFRRG